MIVGGEGDDHLIVDYRAITSTVELGPPWVSGNRFIYLGTRSAGQYKETVDAKDVERLTLMTGACDDIIIAPRNADVISTGAGNDYISTRGPGPNSWLVSGRLRIDAGDGVDRVDADWSDLGAGSPVVLDTTGEGSVTIGAGDTERYLRGVEVLSYFRSGVGDDRIVLNAAAGLASNPGGQLYQIVYTGAGDDRLTVRGGLGDAQTGFFSLYMHEGDDQLIVDMSASLERFSYEGGWGDDVLSGGAGADWLDGQSGRDELTGGAGPDHFYFTTSLDDGAVDVITDFSAKDDTIYLDARVFTAFTADGAVAPAVFRNGRTATGAADRILYDQATETLFYDADGAGGGNAVAFATIGNRAALTSADFRIRGAAAEVMVESAASYAFRWGERHLTLIGAANVDGTGDVSSNVITGNSGNNVLDVGRGADRMAGGAGDDRYVVENAGDVVLELAGEGTDTVETSKSLTLGDHVENLIALSGEDWFDGPRDGDIDLTGNALGNRIAGNNGWNRISGGDGDDVLSGGGGHDWIDGGTGVDTLALDRPLSSYSALRSGDTTFLLGFGETYRVTGIEQVRVGDGPAQAWDMGLAQTAAFDGLRYIAGYADLRTAFGMDGAAASRHYVQWDASEARGVTFDALGYIAGYADLRAAFGMDASAGARHFVLYGEAEGRRSEFDAYIYLAGNIDLLEGLGPDLAAATWHYIIDGTDAGLRYEGFEALEYIASYSDLSAAFESNEAVATRHFVRFGHDEGRVVTFDSLGYIASYGDLIAAFSANADAGARHFIAIGRSEGRHVSFDPIAYALANPDVHAAHGFDTEALARHYVQWGFGGSPKADRPAHPVTRSRCRVMMT